MERNAGYEIKRLLLYDDNKGFALGENLRAPDPYVTWKVTEEQGRRSFDWGHYFTQKAAATIPSVSRTMINGFRWRVARSWPGASWNTENS